jgi:hypothetical protein
MDSCAYTGNINIPGTYASTDTTTIGGVVGYLTPISVPTVKNCVARGDIRFEGKQSRTLHLGGVAGYLDGLTTGVRLEDCSYDGGNILFAASAGSSFDAYIGGLVGSVTRYSTIVNCRSLASSVSAYHATNGGPIMVGGFAGILSQVDIEGCYSTSPVSVPAVHQGSAAIYIGGFAGDMRSAAGLASSMKDCYAAGAVTSYGGGQQYSGGLVGNAFIQNSSESSYPANSINRCYASGAVSAFNKSNSSTANIFFTGGLVGAADGTNISECYATGAVSAQKSGGAAPVNAGGLVGFLGGSNTDPDRGNAMKRSSITDCYALGDVFADNPTSANAAVYAGGLVGYAQITSDPADGKIANNFAAGSVTAQSASSSAVYAGGIAGYLESGALSNNAAVTRSTASGGMTKITLKGGGSTTGLGRVYGGAPSSGPTFSGNRALDAMYLGKTADYYDYSPPYAVVSAADDADATSKEGQDVSIADLRTSVFWDTGGIGFDSAYWNFNGVARGYPALKNAGGQ